jgi:hypothetical protein
LQRKNKERWLELTEQAANEQDSEKMLLLIKEINDLLEVKEKRLLLEARAKSPLKPE